MAKHRRRSQRPQSQYPHPQWRSPQEAAKGKVTGQSKYSPAYPVSIPETSPTVTFAHTHSSDVTHAVSRESEEATTPVAAAPQRYDAVTDDSSSEPNRSLIRRVLSHWLFWMTVSIAVTGGVAGFAGATLFTLPSLPNCPKIFWPTASASLRMYCADLAASKNTTKDLLAAIDLVSDLPESHPMRGQVDALVERWALDILNLAEVSFHNGDLDGAITSARRVPQDLKAYERAEERIEQWQTTWSKAEKIYQEAEGFLEQEDLRGAFAIAVKLLSVGNEFWETDQYDALTGLIETSRVDTEKLNEARRLARGRNVPDLLEAIHLVKEIQPGSRLYPPARRALGRFLDRLVVRGIEALDQGDSDVAMLAARNLPNGVEFQAKAQDLRELSFALAQAESGTITDLEAAIVQAQEINPNRPLYSKAQDLVANWTLEIQNVRQLARARELASAGQIPDLQAAIAEAELVGYNHPRGDDARSVIDKWTRQIQTMEDRPYLRDARALARRGDIRSLQLAIQRAERITEDRPLHDEANELIRTWSRRVESIQDQPYLNDAAQFAARGNLPAAIAAARQVGEGRVLYDDAQASIREWQDQINGEIFFQDAYETARRGTPAAWARAIRTANRIPDNHLNRAEADRLINRWSQNILVHAQQTATAINYQEAINIASMVPQRTEAYAAAQLQIETWQRAIANQEGWSSPVQPASAEERVEGIQPIPDDALNAEPVPLEETDSSSPDL